MPSLEAHAPTSEPQPPTPVALAPSSKTPAPPVQIDVEPPRDAPAPQTPRPHPSPAAPPGLNLAPWEAPRVEVARPAPAQIAPADVPEAAPQPSKAPVASETAPQQPPPSLAKYVAIPLPEELGGDTLLARVVTDDVEAPPQPPKTPPAAGQVIVADAEPSEDGTNSVLRLFDRTIRLEVSAGTRVALRIEAVVPDLGLPSGWLRNFSVQTLLDAGIPPTPDRVAAVQRAAELVPPHLAEGVRALATMLVAKGLPVEPRGIRELAMRNPEGVQRLASLGRLVRLSELAGVSLPASPGSDAASIATLGERVAQSLSAARTAGAGAPALDALLRRIPEPTPAPVPVTDLATSLTRELSSLDVDLPAGAAGQQPNLQALLGTPIPPHVISDLLSPPPSTSGPSEDALLRNLVGLLRPVVDRGAEALRDTLARAVQTALSRIPREGIESLVRSLEAMPASDPVRGLLLEQARRALAGTADAAVERVLAEVERGGGLRELTSRVREALEGADRRTLASVRSALAEKERATLRETPGLPQLQSLYGEARALFDRLGALKLMDVATLPRDEKALHFQLPLVVDGQIRNAQLRVTYRERRDDEGSRSRYEMTGMVLRVELSRIGPVTSKVDVRGDGLSVVFRVDSPQTKALLEGGRGDLEAALRELGRDAVVRVALSGPDDADPFVPPPVRALADVDVTA